MMEEHIDNSSESEVKLRDYLFQFLKGKEERVDAYDFHFKTKEIIEDSADDKIKPNDIIFIMRRKDYERDNWDFEPQFWVVRPYLDDDEKKGGVVWTRKTQIIQSLQDSSTVQIIKTDRDTIGSRYKRENTDNWDLLRLGFGSQGTKGFEKEYVVFTMRDNSDTRTLNFSMGGFL